MSSSIEKFGLLPNWKLAAIGVATSLVLVGAWYFVFFADVEEALESAESERQRNEAELAKNKKSYENFEKEMKQWEQTEAEISQQTKKLPQVSTTDYLSKMFHQQARMVGLQLDQWAPGGEEFLDYSARIPIEVSATGTWNQVGEFFRRISEQEQIINIEDFDLKAPSKKQLEEHPELKVNFQASTFRFVEKQGPSKDGKNKKSRRTGNSKKGGK